jgi:hypothetical protein
MRKSTNIVKQKAGRPVQIGATEFVGLRLPFALLKRIDEWAGKKKRSAAIRELIDRGLKK